MKTIKGPGALGPIWPPRITGAGGPGPHLPPPRSAPMQGAIMVFTRLCYTITQSPKTLDIHGLVMVMVGFALLLRDLNN